MRKAFTWLGLALGVILIALGALIAGARSHGGYPEDCCANQHCHPVPCGELKFLGHGFRWHKMIFTDVRESPDGACHVCHQGEDVPLCVMPGGST